MGLFKFIWSKLFLKQLGLAVLALILVGWLLLQYLNVTTNHGDFIKVPQLEKQTLDIVEMKLNDAKLRFEVRDSANYNPNFPKHSVIEQQPEAGTQVKKDRKIYLTLNPSGYRKVSVPDVRQKTRRNAEPVLKAMGFNIGKITFRNHISQEVLEMRHDGSVIKPGQMLPQTSKIDLVVGDGKGRLVVPDDPDEEEGDIDEGR